MWVFVNTKLQSLTWLCTFRITPPEAHSKSGRGTDKLNCCMSPFNSWLGKSRSLNEAPAAVLSWARCGDSGGAGLRVAFLFCFVTCRKLMDLPVWWQYGQPSVSPSISREYFLSPPWSLWMPLPFPLCFLWGAVKCLLHELHTQLGWSSLCLGSSRLPGLYSASFKGLWRVCRDLCVWVPALQRASYATEFIIFNFQSLVV